MRSRAAIVAFSILQNWRMKLRTLAGTAQTTRFSTHRHATVAESVAYAEGVFQDYLHAARAAPDALLHTRVLEIGPGNDLGVALEFLAAGASEVVAIDKFHARRDTARERELYDLLRSRLDDTGRQRLQGTVASDGALESAPAKLRYLPGCALEACEGALAPASFDYIVSRAVLEEIHEIDAAFAAMDRALRPGGVMVHRIDLRDYGTFSNEGMHPLTFLTVPDLLYRWMSTDTRKPNRRLREFYRHKLTGWEYDVQILVTHVLGAAGDLIPHRATLQPDVDYTARQLDLVHRIRPRLRGAFRACTDEELLTTGIVLVGRKPAAHAGS